MNDIGFMQGRLSPQISGKIQAFPWESWREEFEIASSNGFHLMEWTLDMNRLYENPLMTMRGRREIKVLSENNRIYIKSVTADCFMEAPFHKASTSERAALLDTLESILEASAELGIGFVILPLVDNGRIEDKGQECIIRENLQQYLPFLRQEGVSILFESDYPPQKLTDFIIGSFPTPEFGINYDMGNSASLGYDPKKEIMGYGERIFNVHVKDRVFGGTTVPLRKGAVNLPLVFSLLRQIGYKGNYILQTARSRKGDDVAALLRYREMVCNWLNQAD